jgi:hypothetical protein
MLDRLHGEQGRGRRRALTPVAWHGRFVPSPASAEPDLVLPPVMEPPAPAPIAPSVPVDEAATDVIETLDVGVLEDEHETPATVSPLDLDMFIAPASHRDIPVPEAPPVRPVEVEPEPPTAHLAPPPPVVTPRPIAHEALEPEVRALVDDLYEQARAELSGFDTGFDSTAEPEADALVEEPTIDEVGTIAGDEAYDTYDVEAEAPESARVADESPPAPERPGLTDPPAPSASTSAVGDIVSPSAAPPPASRGGWVPAFVAEDQQRRLSD